jgi:two-component system LytT family sensor kinase
LEQSEQRSHRKLHWLYVFLAVTLISFLFACQSIFNSLREQDTPLTMREALLWQMEWWYLWLMLSPFILKLAGKFPIDRKKGLRNLIIHIPAAIFFVIVQIALFTIVDRLFESHPYSIGFLDAVIKTGLYDLNLEIGIILYAVMVSIASAMKYYEIYQQQELMASRLEAQLAQTRFQALKVQIYPHFLFNTLGTICNLMKKNVEQADRMIARLGDFLRLTMENIGTQEVALQKELTFLRCYLEIESIRMNNQLTYDADIDPDSLNAQIPNLLLQPLVESLLPETAPVHIKIMTRRQNGILKVRIEEDGPVRSDQNSGILAQMTTRLGQIYGNDYRFDVDARTRILEIPFTPV